jgi:hypothetical protein
MNGSSFFEKKILFFTLFILACIGYGTSLFIVATYIDMMEMLWGIGDIGYFRIRNLSNLLCDLMGVGGAIVLLRIKQIFIYTRILFLFVFIIELALLIIIGYLIGAYDDSLIEINNFIFLYLRRVQIWYTILIASTLLIWSILGMIVFSRSAVGPENRMAYLC